MHGKVAVITGGGRGIGRQIALDLAASGCRTVVAARSEAELDEVAAAIARTGGQALTVCADLSEAAAVDRLADEAIREFGAIDILINNAGIIIPKPLLETTDEEWYETFAINVDALFKLSKRALADMKRRRAGYIVNLSSTVALGVPAHLAAYGASKCAVAGLSEALYETGKEFGVKVSTVYPGITDTRMVRDIGVASAPADWMLPEDISNCVLFLLRTSERCVVRELVPWSTGYDKI
nr:SDR family oxidoreductase [Paenibacillus sacheonensis]